MLHGSFTMKKKINNDDLIASSFSYLLTDHMFTCILYFFNLSFFKAALCLFIYPYMLPIKLTSNQSSFIQLFIHSFMWNQSK